jgi:signal transduction histidine kinase
MGRTPGTRAMLAENEVPDLAELCRVHEVGLDLIGRSDDLDDLIDRVLDEYEQRLAGLPGDAFARGGPASPEAARKVRALVMFASQAAALREKAQASARLRERAAALESANARLDGILASLAAGVVIVGADERVVQANRSALALLGEAATPGNAAPAFVLRGAVGTEQEVAAATAAQCRVLIIARHAIDDGTTVVLLGDVTAQMEQLEERHRIEKLAEVLRTLSVLSHKINNPLTALLGRAQLLSLQRDLPPDMARAVEVIASSSLRIADLIKELATVVKEGRQEAVDQLLDMGALASPPEGPAR